MQALEWAISVARALADLHLATERGYTVIHRDVKKENVLLSRVNGQLEAKLCDFGLAAVGLGRTWA